MAEEPVKITSMRIGSDVTRQAKIAASFKGMTVLEYVTRVVLEATARDIEEFRRAGAPAAEKPRRSKG